MSEIDWANAPEWADKYGAAGPQSLRVWFNKDQYVYFDDAGRKPLRFGDTEAFTRDRDQFTVIAERPSQAWSGEGLPPVGALVDAPINGFRYMCELLAIDGDECAVRMPGAIRVVNLAELRPIRTPEQIEAEARSKECDRIYGILSSVARPGNKSDMAEALYDAGVRLPKLESAQ